jgi:iron complex transport system ATP-binding protein
MADLSLLTAENVSLTLGGQPILKSLSLELKAGEMLGLIGPNGAGKSSLLKTLAGIHRAASGDIALNGSPLHKIDDRARARLLGYLAQAGTAHWPISVERIVALGRIPHLGNWQQATGTDRAIVDETLQKTGLSDLATRPFPTLSGGEKARVLLARALAVQPTIILADEPVAALDLSHQLEVMDLLRAQCDNGGAVVVVLHDLRLAAHYCDRLQLLLNGETLAVGDPEAVISDDNLQRAFAVRVRHPGHSLLDAFALSWTKSDPSE